MSDPICHCRCERNMHFDKKHACMRSGCDCPSFRDAREPNPIKPKRPDHAWHCRCVRCKEALGVTT